MALNLNKSLCVMVFECHSNGIYLNTKTDLKSKKERRAEVEEQIKGNLMESDNKSSIALRLPLLRLEEKLKENRDIEEQKLIRSLETYPTPHAFLSAQFPVLAEDAPQDVLGEEVVRLSVTELRDAVRRRLACRKCPSGGGGCAADRRGHQKGLQPVWKNGQLVFSSCDRWADYETTTRIQQFGVPSRLSAWTVSDVHELVKEEKWLQVRRFIKECQRRPAWAVFGGPLSTAFCVGALRTITQNMLTNRCQFFRAPALQRPLKNFFSDQQDTEDPLKNATNTTLLVITELRPKRDPQWFTEVIQELCRTRYLESKATIIGVDTISSKELQTVAVDYFGDSDPAGFDSGEAPEEYNPDCHVHVCDRLIHEI